MNTAPIDEFLAETEEMLERIALNLNSMEIGKKSEKTINDLYRDIHSIKGSSYLFNFADMGLVAHAMESCLDPVRNESIEYKQTFTEAFYKSSDLIHEMIGSIKAKKEGDDFTTKINEKISALVSLGIQSFEGDILTNKTQSSFVESDKELQKSVSTLKEKKYTPKKNFIIKKKEDGIHKNIEKDKKEIPQPEKEKHVIKTKTIPNSTPLTNDKTPAKENIPQCTNNKTQEQKEDEKTKLNNRTTTAENLRVSVKILDKIMNLVGELVLVRNQCTQNSTVINTIHLQQSLNYVTTTLQETILQTRMQPLTNTLNTFHRVVRELAISLGKKASLTIEGSETELDRTLLEAIKDPLIHVVRNAIDHGIEMPADRVKSGKNELGSVKISSYQFGGQVIIEITDDGQGLNLEKLKKKIVGNKLASEAEVSQMDDRQIFMYIFNPGFSTAEKISMISGRGVGMDVVKNNLEKIGGSVDISSKKNQGTSIQLKVPLTLAIIHAISVTTCGENYFIPLSKLNELINLDNEKAGIETIHNTSFYRRRGHLVPLVYLSDILETTNDQNNRYKNINSHIVILNTDDGNFGLVVDEINDSIEIVVKPIISTLKNLDVYSGSSIQGDGKVSLILEVSGIAKKSGIFTNKKDNSFGKGFEATPLAQADDIDTYLLFSLGQKSTYAIPLCFIYRLEELKASKIELSGEQKIYRYKNSIMPIYNLAKTLKLSTPNKEDDADLKTVIVVKKSEKYYGFEIDKFHDILQINAKIDSSVTDRAGIYGNICMKDQSVVVLDVFKILNIITGNQYDMSNNQTSKSEEIHINNLKLIKKPYREKHKILLVEDNLFFRKHISKILLESGFELDIAKDGEAGYHKFKDSPNLYSLIISDIEMPVMDGFELAKKIRNEETNSDIPLVALTTRFRKSDIEKGIQSGFNRYLEKLDADQIIETLDVFLEL